MRILQPTQMDKHNWHPYTAMKDIDAQPPLHIDHAQGVYLYDSNGKAYIDGISSWWCNIHGHNHPVLNQAIAEQSHRMSHIMFAGLTHTPAITLSKALIEVAPKGLERVFYTDNGSCAIECAMKLSLQYWQLIGKPNKTTFLGFENCYHGDTFGTMGIGQVQTFKQAFSSVLLNAHVVPIGDLDTLETLLKNNHATIAAMIIEPLFQGAGGM